MNERSNTEQTRRDRGRRFGGALLILLNIAVLACAALRERGGVSAAAAPGFGPCGRYWLLGACGCLCLCLGAETAKYLLMMRALGARVSARAAFETTALGKYYDSITPSGAGGQPFQIWWLHRRGYDGGAAGAMPIVSFLTMQAGFILPALLIFAFCRAVEVEAIRYTAWLGLVFFSLAPGLLTWFSVSPRTAERALAAAFRLGARLRLVKDPEKGCRTLVVTLTRYHDSFSALAGKRGLFAALLLLSALYRLALCSIPWFVLHALGTSVPYGAALALTFYVYAASTVIPTPGNAGAAEGAFYLAFSAAGAGGVFWAMLLWRLLCYYSVLLLGALIQLADALTTRARRSPSVRHPVPAP